MRCVQRVRRTSPSIFGGARSEEPILRKPTKAMLFDPVRRETSVTTYDRTDPETMQTVLGGSAVGTEIRVQGFVRWVVYSRATSESEPRRAGIAIRTIPMDEELLFEGASLLVSKRGLYEYSVDLDLLWPTFEFRWIGGEDAGEAFRLGQQHVGYRSP
jgi:hypothetical protein